MATFLISLCEIKKCSCWLEDSVLMEKSLGSNTGKSVGCGVVKLLFSKPRIVGFVSRLLIGVNGSIIIKDIKNNWG
jgi:hypothetical protein